MKTAATVLSLAIMVAGAILAQPIVTISSTCLGIAILIGSELIKIKPK
jgi:hypothetical protein